MTTALRGNSLYTNVSGSSWNQAETNAVNAGGHLATIGDSNENAWLADIFKDPLSVPDTNWNSGLRSGAWIGLNDIGSDGIPNWVDGSSVTFTNYGVGGQSTGNAGIEDGWLILMLDPSGEAQGRGGLNTWWVEPAAGINAAWSYNHGIAEIPLTLSITRSGSPTEGAGVFTTSINLSAGTSTNLANGTTVYWTVSGITSDDLASGSLTGSGTISNGKLDIQHSLVSDSDSAENFEISVYSDSDRTLQIGSTASIGIQEQSTGGGGGGGSSSATPASPATPATPADPGTPGSPAIPATPPTTPATPVPSIKSPVLGIQPQETVTTVELTTPLTLGNLQVTQVVVGTPQNDVITGSAVGEALAGGKGKDQMTGGGGPDAFLFETPGEFGKKSLDIVTDFNPGEGDKLVISKDAFDEVRKVRLDVVNGKKDAKNAASSNKTFIYDEKNGMLYFNENGKKDGFGDGGEFVKLLGAPEIGKGDFVLV